MVIAKILSFPQGPRQRHFETTMRLIRWTGTLQRKSFWYASSRKDTLEAIIQHTNNENNKDDDYETIPVVWDEIDANSSIIKFVYVNEAGNEGPATLMISNWKNIDMENPPENNTLEFGKSKTAFIPSLIGLILILLVLAAEVKPSARKHIMHLTVLLGLVAFFMVAKMFGPAFAEMSWLRGEPNHIEHTCTIIKPITMLASAGLLLIFVILCVVSFIQARKEMAAQAKKDKLAKKNASQSKPKYKKEDSKNEEKENKTEKTTRRTRVIRKVRIIRLARTNPSPRMTRVVPTKKPLGLQPKTCLAKKRQVARKRSHRKTNPSKRRQLARILLKENLVRARAKNQARKRNPIRNQMATAHLPLKKNPKMLWKRKMSRRAKSRGKPTEKKEFSPRRH